MQQPADIVLKVWQEQAFSVLSPDELGVMEGILDGATMREVAARCDLSLSAAQRLKRSAQRKLQDMW